jgi:hypothetical protein
MARVASRQPADSSTEQTSRSAPKAPICVRAIAVLAPAAPPRARAELPPGVTITKLPIVGRTWYKRGIAYWARRAGCVLVLLAGAAVYATFIGAAMLAAGRPGSPGFLAVLAAESVFSPVTAVLFFRHLWKLGTGGHSGDSSDRREALVFGDAEDNGVRPRPMTGTVPEGDVQVVLVGPDHQPVAGSWEVVTGIEAGHEAVRSLVAGAEVPLLGGLRRGVPFPRLRNGR